MDRPAATDYWPMLKAYHCARYPLYRAIIQDALPPAARAVAILDAGCGDGCYGRLIADLLGPPAWVVAFDRERRGLADQTASSQVAYCQGDMELAGLQTHAFDAIWLCRSLHSAADPPARLRALARLLRPGGRLIVVENDFAHHPILAWPADFERRVFAAHFQ